MDDCGGCYDLASALEEDDEGVRAASRTTHGIPSRLRPAVTSRQCATLTGCLAAAHELEAKTLFLQSPLEYTQANDEMTEAMGQTLE